MMLNLDSSKDAVPVGSIRQAAAHSRFWTHLRGSGLEDCFEFWCSRRVDGDVPMKRSIDPVEMPRHILPNLFIYELVDGRFRCRLAGTELVSVFKAEPTGRFLDTLISPSAVEGRTRLYRGVVGTGMPVIYGGDLTADDSRSVSFRRLLLPVTKDGSQIDIVFGMVVFPAFQALKAGRNPLGDLPHEFEAWASPADMLPPG